MCRWMAWSGQPVIVEELLFKPPHGLIDQSLHSRLVVQPGPDEQHTFHPRFEPAQPALS